MSRRTDQREAILDALSASDRAVTAQELHGQLEGVGLATVYRNLQRLADAGDADTLRRANGEIAFLICGRGPHPPLTCRGCGPAQPGAARRPGARGPRRGGAAAASQRASPA